MVISDDFKRKNINVSTLKKVESFLMKQKKPLFKSEVVRKIGVDYDSLNLALSMLEIQVLEDGRIELC